MALFIRKLGIDLGTANTLVFVPQKGVCINEPSVVAVSVGSKKVLAVGNEAKIMIGRTPENIIAYRPLKNGVIADYRVTEAMLNYFISKSLGRFNIIKPDVMVSVPAGVTSTERRAVVEAAMKAGAKSAYVVKEPILAAIGAGIPIHEPRGYMVVDIGGGTTDSAVIALGGIVTSNSVKVAGDKIDQAIADHIKEHLNLAIGERTAEEIKIAVGSAIPVKEELVCTIKGRDILTGLPRSADISTNEVVKAIQGCLDDIIRSIKTTLQNTPPELSADIISESIVMTGGGSLLRNIEELVYRSTGVSASVANDPLLCVAKGCGTALEHLEAYKKSILLKR
ncbi:MAG: rod shape-determining protein [Candidatus Ryanbacteria bacterium RIFCSPHIGHO2_02_FULL_45_43]|uniref:Cell shape-determining protein MreB n=1 Tax=Candidatus Ryanbacteria bacterium RIFCSPHIGHO2_01_45_13 TaxID=1802112 RepID=A0A1G2FZJ2_9BACT|nr:MAG: rod shape-determining protein [Candidatus Ryanbacteria bacterium RIFCSPHIGHO2_01_FULL_44_130]OGZ42991.1 MAG: rod shape-determining protein [Candidatus Ryanbacteria bacterium RIFCSPHIGHO2_01_45_13]OGZ48696.1 MAG: rod shape-determining protein [Candidatus Ryanbacteria bacterium RIFCSPHIGHO2_02_FULL_45_43]OGZ50636.1 MAG: rod shape-determining protein [Candidatus Ryanbacteria bacterium RIFCSPHIGHO2_12_FULL_44_20]OGZ51942.1 MAG: rod shape-determining protein [Candidatus Ryanbacteria bacteriu